MSKLQLEMGPFGQNADSCFPQDAQTSAEQETDYGSKQANEAVKQLQQLGAIVYHPAEKKDVDWGLLAGSPSTFGCEMAAQGQRDEHYNAAILSQKS